jgi:hypothetical protein
MVMQIKILQLCSANYETVFVVIASKVASPIVSQLVEERLRPYATCDPVLTSALLSVLWGIQD